MLELMCPVGKAWEGRMKRAKEEKEGREKGDRKRESIDAEIRHRETFSGCTLPQPQPW